MKNGNKGKGGAGAAFGVLALLGAAAGWVVYDMRKPDSFVRSLIEIGRARLEGNGLDPEDDMEAAMDVQGDVMDLNKNGEQVPPPEQMPS